MKPKVLVGCPISDHGMYSFEKYLEGVKGLTYSNFDVLLVDNSKGDDLFNEVKSKGINVVKVPYTESARDRIVKSRNVIVEELLKGDYDYFLSLEFDVVPPEDVIHKLLSHSKKIVSGVYFKPINYVAPDGKVLKREIVPIAYKGLGNSRVRRMTFDEVREEGLHEVRIVGLGCMLISRELFEKGLRFRYDKDKSGFDDKCFCLDALKEGYKIYLDSSVKCLHLVKEKNWKEIKK